MYGKGWDGGTKTESKDGELRSREETFWCGSTKSEIFQYHVPSSMLGRRTCEQLRVVTPLVIQGGNVSGCVRA
eukprot:8611642-Ditylum_brightwellii.AAC.2